MDLLLHLDKGPSKIVRQTNYRFLPPIRKWKRFVLHKHDQPYKRRAHWDLRIEVPSAGGLRSFAIPKQRFPKRKKPILFIETTIHPEKFLHFEKEVKRGPRKGETIKIIDTGKYYTHRATEKFMLITLRGRKTKGTYYMVRTRNNNWIVGKYKKSLKPRMRKEEKIEISAAMPNKSKAAVSQIIRHWKAEQDPEWRKATKKFPELEEVQKKWRLLVHDFWSHQDQYSKTFKSIRKSARKGNWREDDLYMLKQEFFDLRQPAGQLMIRIKRGTEKEAKIALQVAKEMGLRQSHPKVKIYRTLSRYGLDQIWRLLVVLMFDQPHLFGQFDRAAVGREWAEVWSKLGILGKGEGPK